MSRIKYAMLDFYPFDNLGRHDIESILMYGVHQDAKKVKIQYFQFSPSPWPVKCWQMRKMNH